MQTQRTPEQQQRLREIFDAIGRKGEFARVAAKELRKTKAYAEARDEGRARQWLAEESNSFAESAYMVLLDRVEEANL